MTQEAHTMIISEHLVNLSLLLLLLRHPSSHLFIVLYGILTGIADLFGGIILLAIGVLIIIVVVAAAIVLLPAFLVAFLVWLLTASFFYAGIAFLIVALISVIAMAGD
jgi:hypothetical protein